MQIDGPQKGSFQNLASGQRYVYVSYALRGQDPVALLSRVSWHVQHMESEGTLVWRVRPTLEHHEEIEKGSFAH